MDGLTPRWPFMRGVILLVLGAGVLIHETVIHVGPERPTLILAALALMGLPVFLAADEKKGRETAAKEDLEEWDRGPR